VSVLGLAAACLAIFSSTDQSIDQTIDQSIEVAFRKIAPVIFHDWGFFHLNPGLAWGVSSLVVLSFSKAKASV